jgi:hypothetical protein
MEKNWPGASYTLLRPFWEHLGAFGSILEHFEAFWSILEHFRAFWALAQFPLVRGRFRELPERTGSTGVDNELG